MTDEPVRQSKKTEMIEVRVSHETKRDFLAACRGAGRSASDVVREAVQTFIEEQKRPKVQPQHKRPLTMIIPKPIRKKRYLAAGAGLAGLAMIAALPSAAAPNLRSAFEGMDANRDGVLSVEEFVATPSDAKQVTIRPMKKLPAGTTVPHIPVAGEKQLLFILPQDGPPPQMQKATHQSFEPKQAPTMAAVRRAMFELTDADGDGKVSLAEYVARQSAALVDGFEHLDTDKDGALSAAEYAKLSTTIMAWPVDTDTRFPTTVSVGPAASEEAVSGAFAKLDKDGDGKLSPQEYLPPS